MPKRTRPLNSLAIRSRRWTRLIGCSIRTRPFAGRRCAISRTPLRRRSPRSVRASRAKGSAPRFSPARARMARGTATTSPTGCRPSSRCSCCVRPASTAPILPSPSAVARLQAGFRWHESFGAKPFFDGEVEPCINGGALALGAYFGRPSESLARRLVGEQLEDGGWNCDAPKSARSSFHTTICVLEGLLEYERAVGSSPEIAAGKTTRRGVPARARSLPAALDRRGREPGVSDVRVPAPLRLRRPPRARLLQGRRCPARRAHRRCPARRREQAAARRPMAPRSRARRGARASAAVRRVGGRAEPVEHAPGAARAAVVPRLTVIL